MHEQEAVATFIDRIVAGAQIPSRTERESLRRELWTHFEDADTSSEAVQGALGRFGTEDLVIESFRRVYRRDYVCLYLVKVAASIAASVAVALLIQVLVNLRVAGRANVWQLAPRFWHAAGLSVGVVLGLVTLWEVGRQPFNRLRAVVAVSTYVAACLPAAWLLLDNAGAWITPTVLVIIGYVCSKLERRPIQLLVTFAAFAAAQYTTHVRLSIAFGPGRALLAAAELVAIWTSTVLILGRLDHAFIAFFETAHRTRS